MKKFTLVMVMTFCVSLICSAKSFYYYGVGFEYERGWHVSGSPNGIVGSNDESRIYISFSQIHTKHTNMNRYVSAELEKKINDIIERGYSNKKIKLRKKSEILEGEINGIPVQFVDMSFSGKVCKRYYCFEHQGYLFDIEISGEGNNFYKAFKKILNSFAFVPER